MAPPKRSPMDPAKPGSGREGDAWPRSGLRCRSHVNPTYSIQKITPGRIFLRKTLFHPSVGIAALIAPTGRAYQLKVTSFGPYIQFANPNAAVNWLSKTCRTAALSSNVFRLTSH